MLRIYERLFSVRFAQVGIDGDNATSEALAASVWHPDVQLYVVTDAAPSGNSAVLGRFYLDLHPREGKYSHGERAIMAGPVLLL